MGEARALGDLGSAVQTKTISQSVVLGSIESVRENEDTTWNNTTLTYDRAHVCLSDLTSDVRGTTDDTHLHTVRVYLDETLCVEVVLAERLLEIEIFLKL